MGVYELRKSTGVGRRGPAERAAFLFTLVILNVDGPADVSKYVDACKASETHRKVKACGIFGRPVSRTFLVAST